MSEDIVYNVKELLEPLLRGKGLELFDVEYKGSGKRGVLRVFIDKEEGVTVDDCALVSRELGRSSMCTTSYLVLHARSVVAGPYEASQEPGRLHEVHGQQGEDKERARK